MLYIPRKQNDSIGELEKRGYKQISLPLAMLESIAAFIKEHPELGYTSNPDFIKDAIREKLRKPLPGILRIKTK